MIQRNNIMCKLVFAVSLLCMSAAFCAAQTNEQKAVFHAADTNLDGKISKEEFKSYAKQAAFSRIDGNRDGKVDKKEWQAAAPKAEADFDALAQSSDKSVTFMEFSNYADKKYTYDEMFNQMDRNRDGSLAPDEFNDRPAFTIFSIKF